MAGRVRVAVQGGLNKSILIHPNATPGATIGVDLLLPNGQIATLASLAAALGITAGAFGGGGVSPANVAWSRILDIPANVTGVAAMSDTGVVVRHSDNSFHGVTITGTAGRVTVANGDGVSGAPTIDLATFGAASVLGVAGASTAEPAAISSAADKDVLHRSGTTLSFSGIDHSYISDFNEAAQDAVGGILTDTTTIDFTYDDAGNAITADVKKTLDHTWITDFDTEAATVAAATIAASSIDALSDVIITSPATNDVLTWNGSDWVNLPASGGYTPPVTTKGDLFGYDTGPARVPVGTDGWVLTADSSQALGLKWAAVGGTGTVTSVDLADTSSTAIYNTSGGPITGAGTLDFSLKTQNANLVFAGPTTGAAAVPTFRSLVAADIPSLPYATSPLTTKGDIWVYGSGDTRLPVGTDTFVLSADSSQSTGLKWIANTTATGANPTASVGLTAVNGSATTYLRSDGAPALSQAIIPTWTGLHLFSANSGLNLTFGAASNAFAQGSVNAGVLNYNSSTGIASIGAVSASGSTKVDIVVANANTAANAIEFPTAGAISAAYGSTPAFFSSAAGSASSTHRLLFGDGSGWSFAFGKRTGSTNTDLWTITDSGNVTSTTANSVPNLTLINSGLANFGLFIDSSATAGARAGLTLKANTASSQSYIALGNGANDLITGSAIGQLNIRSSLGINFSANGATQHMAIASSGAITCRGATAAAQVPMDADEAATTMTTTITTGGFTTALAFATRWVRVGDMVCMYFPSTTGTSSGAPNGQVFQFAAAQLPAVITPARTINVSLNPTWFTNNSVALTAATDASVNITSAAGLAFFLNNSAVGWTAGGTKGINTPFCFTYHLF